MDSSLFGSLKKDINAGPVDFKKQELTKNIFSKNNKKSIEINKDGFYLNGKHYFLRGTSFQWFKMPKEIWEDRIKRTKAAGYNTIDIYIPWRNHEPEEGKFDFKTFDIKRFLELCKKHDMFVCIRPGPFICNEMDGGGIPAWVFTKTSKTTLNENENDGLMNLRTNEKDYLDAVERYYSKVNKEIEPYLYTNGGPIVLYSVENEYDAFMTIFNIDKLSTYKGQPERPYKQEVDVRKYFEKLRNIAVDSGIDVPITTCPGFAKVAMTGDTPNIIPMPNFYAGINNAEYVSGQYLKDMHSDNHNGVYKNLPGGITETYREANHLKRLIIGGMNVVFQFNNIGFSQEGYQNPVFLNGYPPDKLNEIVDNASKMIGKKLSNYNTSYIRPAISYFPGKGDYFGSAISPSGILRDNFYNVRRVNLFMDFLQEIKEKTTLPKKTSQNIFIKDQDRNVLIHTSIVGTKDPDVRSKSVNYWIPINNNSLEKSNQQQKSGALIALYNDGKEDITIPKKVVEAFGEQFPKYTTLTVPVEEGDIVFSKRGIPSKQYTMLIPFNIPFDKLDKDLKLRYSTSEILAVKNFDNEKLLVVYGKKDTPGELCIEGKGLKIINKSENIKINESDDNAFIVSYLHKEPLSLQFEDNNKKKTNIVILNREMAGKSWFTNIDEKPVMISNADYMNDNATESIIEFSSDRKDDSLYTFSLDRTDLKNLNRETEFNPRTGFTEYKIPKITNDKNYFNKDISLGKSKSDNNEANPEFDTTDWISLGDKPQCLEESGIYQGHAWYRAEFDINQQELTQKNKLWVDHAGDFEGIYINGHYLNTLTPLGTEIDSNSKNKDSAFSIPAEYLKTGKNTISFRTEIWGHGSLMFPRGTIEKVLIPQIGPVKVPFLNLSAPYFGYDSVKGLTGEAKFNGKPLTNWKLRKCMGGELKKYDSPQFDDADWKKQNVPILLEPGEMKWYRTEFDSSNVSNTDEIFAPLSLNIKGKNSKGTIYLNGRLIGRWLSDENWLRKGGWFNPSRDSWTQSSVDSFPIPTETLKKGKNVLSIAFEDTGDYADKKETGVISNINIALSEEKSVLLPREIKNIPVIYKKIKFKDSVK